MRAGHQPVRCPNRISLYAPAFDVTWLVVRTCDVMHCGGVMVVCLADDVLWSKRRRWAAKPWDGKTPMELRQVDVGCRPRRLPGVPGPIRRTRVRLGGRHTACCWRSASTEPGLFQYPPHPLWLGKSVSEPLGYSTGSYSTLSYSYSQPLYSCMGEQKYVYRKFSN